MNVTSRRPAVSIIKFSKAPSKRQLLLAERDAKKKHFMTRFRERVGYALSNSSYNELLCNFSLQGKFLYKNKEVGSVYAFTFRGTNLRIVYDPFKQHLITVLPPVIDFKGRY